jgi:hypothetical protein
MFTPAPEFSADRMNHKHKAKRQERPKVSEARRWRTRDGVLLVSMLAVGMLIGAGYWNYGGGATEPPASPAVVAERSGDSTVASDDYGKLIGKWARTDGGYVLDIKSVERSGAMEAAYLNPKPIRVARAEAKSDGTTIKAFVELRDVNYPGSTYDLVYEPQRDQLVGVYFQAVEQRNFDVSFRRSK